MKSAKEWREHFDAGVRGDGNYQLDMENFVEAVREEMRVELAKEMRSRSDRMTTLPSVYRGGWEDAADFIEKFGKAKP